MHLVTRTQLLRRLSRQKKTWSWSQKINFINLPSTYSLYKEDKRILANVISSFPLVNPDDAVRTPGLFPSTCGTSQDLTRRFFWPTAWKQWMAISTFEMLLPICWFFLAGAAERTWNWSLWEAFHFPHHSGWCHVPRTTMFNLPYVAVTIHNQLTSIFRLASGTAPDCSFSTALSTDKIWLHAFSSPSV